MDKKLYAYDLTFVLMVGMLAMLHYLAWANFPPDVDPIHFTFALSHNFSPAVDTPHPPGYPLYVFAGRLAAALVGEHHAYQFVNLSMLLGSGGALYWLFRHFNAAAVGIASAVLLMSHPLAWAATVIPECYVSDLFFGCAILALVMTQQDSGRRLLTGVFILFFLLGLIRPVSGAMLLPLAMVASYKTTHSKSRPIFVAVAATIAVALAYAITVSISGGWETYRTATDRVMGEAFRKSSIFGGAPLSAHLFMLQRLFGWLLFFSLPMAIIMFIAGLTSKWKLQFGQHASALMIGGAWLLPPLAFYSLIYYLKPTYQLIYLPCLLIPIAWALLRKDSTFNQLGAKLILSGLVIVQFAIFFLPIPNTPEPIRRLTHAYFTQQDQAWEELTQKLAAMPRKNTLLIWAAHPSLTGWAVRLLDWEGPIGMAFPTRSRLDYIDSTTKNWVPSGEADTKIDKKYDGVVIVDELAGKCVVQYIPLKNRQLRRVDYLLKRARRSAFNQSS